MDHSETSKLGRRFADALLALEKDDDLDGIVELFSEDAKLENAALDLSGKAHEGHSGAREFWQSYRKQLSGVETEFFHVTGGDDSAGLFWVTRGEAASGDRVEYPGASLLVFDGDGLVKTFRGYYDTRQLTVSKASGG